MEHTNPNLITNSTKQNHLYNLVYFDESNSSDNEDEFLNYFMQKKINGNSNNKHNLITGGRIENKIRKKNKNENGKMKLSQKHNNNYIRCLSSTNRKYQIIKKENNNKKSNNINSNFNINIINKTHKINNSNSKLKNHKNVNTSLESTSYKNKKHISKNVFRNKKNENVYVTDFNLTTPYHKVNKQTKTNNFTKYTNKKITNSFEKNDKSVKNKKKSISNSAKNNKISKINYKNILIFKKKLFNDTEKNLECSKIHYIHENTNMSNQKRKIKFTISDNFKESKNNHTNLNALNTKKSINYTQSYFLSNSTEKRLKNDKKFESINYKKKVLKIKETKENFVYRLYNQEGEKQRNKGKKTIAYRKQVLEKSNNSIGFGEQNKTCKNNKIRIFCYHNKY